MICPVILWGPCFTEGRIRQASAGIFGTASSKSPLCLLDVCRVEGMQEVGLRSPRDLHPEGLGFQCRVLMAAPPLMIQCF